MTETSREYPINTDFTHADDIAVFSKDIESLRNDTYSIDESLTSGKKNEAKHRETKQKIQ